MSTLEIFWLRLVPVTAWMALAVLVVQVLLWIIRPVSPRAHRLAWACVIVSGLFFVQYSVNVPEHRLKRAVPEPLQMVVAPLAEAVSWSDAVENGRRSISSRIFPVATAPLGERRFETGRFEIGRADVPNEFEIARTPIASASIFSGWTWRQRAVVLWALGVAAILAFNVFTYCRLVRQTRRMPAASGQWTREWDDLLAEHKVGRPIPVLMSAACGPAICLTPAGHRLIVPEKLWESLSPAERFGILRHELAHYERNDLLKSLFARCVVALHWLNPAAWWAQRQFNAAGEWACDDFAGERQGRIDFAKSLLQLGGERFPSVPLTDAVGGSPLHSRIRRLLSLSPIVDRRWKTTLVTALSAAVVALALVRVNRVADAAFDSPPPLAGHAQTSAAAVSATGEKSNLGPLADPSLVTGQVFDADGKTPVPQSLVTLQIGGGVWQTQSDSKGNFRFEKRRAEWYDVCASKANLVSNKEHIRNAEQEDSPKSRFPTVRLVMGAGKQLKVQVVSKETGRPIAGTRIRLRYRDRRTMETDATGTALVPGLLAEKQEVVAEAAGFARWAGEFDLSNTAGESAMVISLEPGGRVEGTVTDESGRPIERAFMDGRRVGSPDYYRLDSPRTDRLGRFHDNYLPLDTPIQMTPGHKDYLKCDPQEFTLTAQKPKAELHFILKQRPHFSVEGVVTDEKRKPLSGATVFNHGHNSGEVQKTTTDAHGKFAIADLFEGPGYAIDVRAKGFAAEHETVDAAPGAAPAHVSVKLRPGHFIHGRVVGEDGKPVADAHVHFNSPGYFWGIMDDATRTDDQGRFEFDTLPDLCSFQIEHPGYASVFDKRLQMDRPDAVTVTMSRTWTLRGHVFAADTGKPIEQFNVSNGGLQPTTFQSKDGLFALKDVYASKDGSGRVHYYIRVEADGFRAKPLEELLVARGPSDAILEIPMERLDLSKRTSVFGRIVDARNQPVAGAQLRLVVTSEQPASDHEAHYNWILLKSDQLAQRPEWCEQYLSLVSDADGKFEFKNVLAGKFLQLAYWGKHVPEGRSLAFDKTEPRPLS
ncbi:MAG TPA: carboxypeptidase regulatory-like domain-containing protein, partial [Planctomycetaceae bacterium]|nr:carboxypeptidase regulatory-like domain-containing protein [Planctomycetaceae bacterium]